jgi:hypothetical protein
MYILKHEYKVMKMEFKQPLTNVIRCQNVLRKTSGYNESEIAEFQIHTRVQFLIKSKNVSFFGLKEALLSEFGSLFKGYTLTEEVLDGEPTVVISIYLENN